MNIVHLCMCPECSIIMGEVIYMAMTEAKRRANKKWNDANMTAKYDRISVLVPKGRKQTVEVFARDRGESVNGLVNALLRAEMGLSEDEWKRAGE